MNEVPFGSSFDAIRCPQCGKNALAWRGHPLCVECERPRYNKNYEVENSMKLVALSQFTAQEVSKVLERLNYMHEDPKFDIYLEGRISIAHSDGFLVGYATLVDGFWMFTPGTEAEAAEWDAKDGTNLTQGDLLTDRFKK